MRVITENCFLRIGLEQIARELPEQYNHPIIFIDLTRPVKADTLLPGKYEDALYLYVTEKPLMLALEKLFYNGIHSGGFLHMRMSWKEMVRHIQRTLSGGPPLSFRRPAASLSAKEIQVLHLLSDGRSTQMCADLLGIHPKSVSMHKCRAMNKLGIRRSTGLWQLMIVLKSILECQRYSTDIIKRN